MLIDKINECTSSINELSTLRANALSIKAFEGAVNKLSSVDPMIADFVTTVEEMNRHEFFRVKLADEDVEKIKDAIIECAASVNAMTLDNNGVAAVSTIVQSQKTGLTFLWKAMAKEKVEPIRSYLSVIQIFAPQKEEISSLIKALGTGSKAEPSAAIVRTLVANIEKASSITSNFQMTTGVRAFLQKAENGSATYADITDEVSNWIREHKLASRIKISF